MQLGSHIRSVREALMLTQTDFGKMLGTHYMTVSKWERGLMRPQALELAMVDLLEQAVAKGERDHVVNEFQTQGTLRGLYAAMHVVYK
jgi:DNA-binding XRE family transcriptional regulator